MSRVSSRLFSAPASETRSGPVSRGDSPRPVEDWREVTLPDAWADREGSRGIRGVSRLLGHVFGRRRKVTLPEGLPGAERIPKYALLEFHHLPNGVYSNRLARGYISSFDACMLGEMKKVRRRMAADQAGAHAVIDIGCGGARMAGLLAERGLKDVHGMDPSPYMLQAAAEAYPEVTLTQGIVEDMPFGDDRFDGATVVFVFHEMPPRYVRAGLAEIARVLRPGGRLTVAEPSRRHYDATVFSAIREFGWRGLYFRTLARLVHEPFVRAWHRFDLAEAAAAHGLVLEEEDEGMPIRYWVFRREGS